ncbi:hypothetical protein SCUP515_12555 [Seiridium cupressi]
MSSPAKTRVAWASSADWERHRDEITRLWFTKDISLKSVMAIMFQRYEFRATLTCRLLSEKMFKTQLKKWGLRKNLSKAESDHLREKASSGGTPQLPVVQGRQLGSSSLKALVKTKSQTTCEYQLIQVYGSSHPTSPLPRSVRAPDLFRAIEGSIGAVSNYTQSLLQNNTWDLYHHEFDKDLTRFWGDDIQLAAVQIRERRDLESSFQMLNRSCDMYQSILRRQDAVLVHATYGAFLRLSEAGEEAAILFIKYVAGICSIELGKFHPLTVLWTSVLSMGVSQARQAAQAITGAQFQLFHDMTNPGNLFWATMYLCNVSYLGVVGLLTTPAELALVQSVIREMQSTHGSNPEEEAYWIAWAQLSYCHLLHRSNDPERFIKSDAILQEVENWQYNFGYGYKNNGNLRMVVEYRAEIEEGLGRFDSAEDCFLQLLELSRLDKPRGHRRILKSLKQLENFYRRRNRSTDAAAIHEDSLTELNWLITKIKEEPLA